MTRSSGEQLAHLRLAVRVAGIQAPAIVLPEEHHVVLHGMRFHYLDWGRVGRPPVVFLHGGCLTAHTWDLVCLALRSVAHCLALDQRGHGDSEWSPEGDYRAEAHTADIAAFVDHLGAERVVLVGHSLGALNALAYASRHARRLAGMVLVDVGAELLWSEDLRRTVEFVTAAGEVRSLDELVARALAFNPRRDPRLLRRSLLHNLRHRPDGRLAWKYDRRHLGEVLDAIPGRFRAMRAHASRVACPALVVRGALSDAVSDGSAAALAAAFPRGRWVRVDGAGHTVQGDNPRGLAAALTAFVAECTDASPRPRRATRAGR